MSEPLTKAEAAQTARPVAVIATASLAITVWGATPIVTKIAVGGPGPLALGFLRTLPAAIGAALFIVFGRLSLPRTPLVIAAGAILGGVAVAQRKPL